MLDYAFITFLPAIINLALSAFAWSRNTEARENRLLSLSCFGLSIYCFRTFEVNTRPLETAELIFPALTFGPLLAGTALSDFLMTIADRPLLPKRWLAIIAMYVPVGFFSISGLFINWFFTGIGTTESGVYIPQAGPFNDLINYFLLLLVLIALFKAVRTLLSSEEHKRRKQLTWSMAGIGISFVCMVTLLTLPESIIPFADSAAALTLFVAFSTNLIAGTMVYAIARYGLAPSMEELRRREAEAKAHEAELQHQLLDSQMREKRRRQEELEKELETARQMQMALMPDYSPEIQGLHMAGRCTPASEVGGDYFQYFLRNGKLTFCVADVTGHAMQAAIPVVMFSGILESQMELESPIEELFGRLNRSLHRVLNNRTFVCFTLGEFDLNTHTLRLANSGCPYPYYFSASSGEVKEVQIDTYPLGIRPNSTYDVQEFQLEPGDRVVLCSDGLIEAQNPHGEMFGFERTANIIVQSHRENLDASTLLDRFDDEVQTFAAGIPLEDDLTCVVLALDRDIPPVAPGTGPSASPR